ncbi:MAG: PAS-domain containing protein [Bradyrhizobium sp.]|uniref:PAS-domain containing protein n=1 Tax=Bradyrhizobium sp. TaxID=376 RepID=UPI0027313774|nr:PAS-domain containing protein [Bradyrhizobium sp.]MDP1865470.1 PAS-domain containing protein [Bradyrhizobium sp.]
MPEARRKLKRPAFPHAGTGLFFAGAITLLFLIDLQFRYEDAITQGKRTALNFAEVLSEHTALTFENVERTLREAGKVRKDSLDGDYATPEDTNAALRLLMKTSPVVVAVGWTDASGELKAHSYPGPPPRTNISGMSHFDSQRDGGENRLHIAPPFRSALSNKWFTAASLRLNNDDGTFAGVLTAPLDQSYFIKIYRSIDLGTDGSILLMHTNGQVLAREPGIDGIIGKSFAGGPLLTTHLPKADAGSYETTSVIDGKPRLASYKAIRGLPLVLLVSYTRADALRPWYRHVMIFGPLVALVVAAILLGSILSLRQAKVVEEKSRILELKSRELEQTNQRFDIALSNMPNGLCMWDKEQRLVISNDRYREMYGLTHDQVKPGVSLREVLETHLANGQSSELSIDEYIKVVVSQTAQTHVLADGRTVAMRRQATPDGGWIATHEDISEQKRAEALLRTTLDTMDQGLIAVDRHGTAFLMNARVLHLLGLPREFAVTRPHKNEILEYQRRNGEFSSEQQFTQVTNDIEERRQAIYERERPNGTVLEVRTVPTPDGGFVRTYSDVTARRAAEAELRREKDRAESAARATSEFLANMSHELRTPLTAIIGVSDMLLSRPQSPERQRQFTEMQRSAGQGLLGIINNILDFSKIEAGQLGLEAAPFSLMDVAEGCVSLVHEQAEHKGLEVTAVIGENAPDWVLGDATRLRQVLTNLTANGVKFTPSGTVTLTVDGVPGMKDSVRFAVTDTGIGIKAESLSTIFQRFAQADSSTTRRFGGTGLGLAISRRLVALMGGNLEVQSKLGGGSTFSFIIELPRCSKVELASRPPLPMSRGSYRLLLAEDNAVNRQLIKAMLEQAGHEVWAVNDGAEAVRIAVRNPFDAILMDVQMPDMDGYAATQAIRKAMQDGPSLPIIALTANALSGEAAKCLAAGMSAHVPKPVNWPTLFATIDRLVLENRRRASTARPGATGPEGGLGDSHNPGLFDGNPLSQLRKAIGDQNVAGLMKLFVVEARDRFVSQPVSPEARESLSREAHSFGGSAGMLGFEHLAEACTALQLAEPESHQFEECLDRCRRERDAALGKIAKLMIDDHFVDPAQSTA